MIIKSTISVTDFKVNVKCEKTDLTIDTLPNDASAEDLNDIENWCEFIGGFWIRSKWTELIHIIDSNDKLKDEEGIFRLDTNMKDSISQSIKENLSKMRPNEIFNMVIGEESSDMEISTELDNMVIAYLHSNPMKDLKDSMNKFEKIFTRISENLNA